MAYKSVYALYVNGELKAAMDENLENLEVLTAQANKSYNDNKDNAIEIRTVVLIKSEYKDKTFGEFTGYYESGYDQRIVYDPAGPMETAKRNGYVPAPNVKDVMRFIMTMRAEGYDCWIECAYGTYDTIRIKKETQSANNENTEAVANEKAELINHVAKEIIKDAIASIKEEPVCTGYLEWGDGKGSISLEAYRTYGGELPIPFNYFDHTHKHWFTEIDGTEWHAKVFFSHDEEKSILSAVAIDDPDGDGYLFVDVLDSPVFTYKYDEDEDDDVWVCSLAPYYKKDGGYTVRL